MQGRGKKGRFTPKSKGGYRSVRSIRVTDRAWDKFGDMADEQKITRADLLEQMILSPQNNSRNNGVIHGKIAEIKSILTTGIASKKQGGTYSSNNAKSLKEKVESVLEMLDFIAE